MHEVLLLGIAASELTVLLTSDPRRWSRRLSLFLTFLLAVICYSWFVLGVSAVANAIGATLSRSYGSRGTSLIRRRAAFLLVGRWRPSALSRC